MSAFEDKLNEYLSEATDPTDLRIMVRRFWKYDFLAGAVRVWDGMGKAYSEDGQEWLGTVSPEGMNFHQTPKISDGRDLASPRYQFSLGYIDSTTYNALKASQDQVAGRTITCYLGIFEEGEGLRPQTALDYFDQFTMQSAIFEEKLTMGESGALQKQYVASVVAVNANAGRSRAPGGTYTDTSQKNRASILGVDGDRGCEFVAGLANKTFIIP